MKTTAISKVVSILIVTAAVGFAILHKESSANYSQIEALEIELVNSEDASDADSVERIATALFPLYDQKGVTMSQIVQNALEKACGDERKIQNKTEQYSGSRQRHIFQCQALGL